MAVTTLQLSRTFIFCSELGGEWRGGVRKEVLCHIYNDLCASFFYTNKRSQLMLTQSMQS